MTPKSPDLPPFFATASNSSSGLPESFDPATEDGRGFVFMSEWAAKLGGDLSIQTGPLGMSVRVTMPSQVQSAA